MINSSKSKIIVASIPPQSSKIIEIVRVDRAKIAVDYNKEIFKLVTRRIQNRVRSINTYRVTTRYNYEKTA